MTAARGDVGVFVYEWEAAIPLVPWMIVPYMSIDAFFVAAPFVCTSRNEIRMFVRRVCTAILVAGVCFLLWPLRMGFPRPQVDGLFGPVFSVLHAFDEPHNLFPSLHIALIFIMRWTYHRHARGPWRVVMHVWFLLVTASTLLTHQHHVIDLVGGLVLALGVFYLFPTGLISRSDATVSRAPSPRLGATYGAGTVALVVLAWWVRPWSWTAFWLLLWFAVSLGIVAAGYAGLGPRVFRKYAGYISIPARLLLGPYLACLWLSRKWFWRQDQDKHAELRPGVLFGRLPDNRHARELKEMGVRAVLDLCPEHSEAGELRGLEYCYLPVMDLALPDRGVLDAGAAFVDRARARGAVYVHCGLGYGRSGLIIAHWLLETGLAADLDSAVEAVRGARPRGVSTDQLRCALSTARSPAGEPSAS